MERLYLFSGDDVARIDETRRRLRGRAEVEGGGGALEAFDPPDERRPPDSEALAGALAAMSLVMTRRYLLVDGVERWKAADVDRILPLLADLPDETTLVLIARGKPPAKLAPAVKAAGGEVREFEAPRERQMPKWVADQAARRGFRIEAGAARLLVERMGPNQLRLSNELDRLALWAGEAGNVSEEDLEEMVADTSEAMVWELSDAVIERDARRAIGLAESLALSERGASIVYPVASRLRQAVEARTALDAGTSERDVQASLRMSPYAAKQLVARVGGTDLRELRSAVCALADLEAWTRGEADYSEDVAVTLAVSRAVGVS
jgi:DNA polymerase-3 subunit delta